MSEVKKIEGYTRQWKSREWLVVVFKSLAFAIFISAVCWFLMQSLEACLVTFFIGVIAGGFLFYHQSQLKQINPEGVVRLFNQRYPALEYSSQLILLQPESLSIPARLQRKKVANQLSREKLLSPPVGLTDALLWLLLSLLLSSLLIYFAGAFQEGYQGENAAQQAPGNSADTIYTETFQEQIPELKEGGLQVAPPAYTGQKAYYTQLASLQAPERSRLTWQLEFSKPPERLWLLLSGGDSLAFSSTSAGRFTVQLVLNKSVLYQLVWQEGKNKTATDYLRLEAIPDEPPFLQISNPAQYLRADEPAPLAVQAEAADDYGLTEAYLQLTISQGSGENVSFREEKLWFGEEFAAQPKRMELRQVLDPKSLGMVPGDELYYYLVAFDNQTPKAQRSRSETWFYHWIDTTYRSAFEMGGMAMDIMPDYFRSQRQIIIDTEKLIKEQPDLSEEEFEKRSNNLGVDQKLLRLRYGKFLGEEFESGYGEIGPEEHAEDQPDGEEGKHDEEHASEGASPHEVDHDHELHTHEEPVSPSAASLLREFMHAHDTEEGATFYEESIKVKLKAALAEMWESELRLRTLRPREALPFQYRALEIIKNVQQATRIYVERIGFEPPALKPAEKRLSGELDNVGSVSRTHSEEPVDSLEAIKKLVPLLQGEQPPGAIREASGKAGQELAAIVQAVPRPAYLRALESLGKLAEGKSLGFSERRFLLGSLYSLLPEETPEIRKRGGIRTAMETQFMRKIGGKDE